MSEFFGEAAARLSGAAAMLLGWRPGDFWDATPKELAAMFEASGEAGTPPDAAAIADLMQRFPDR
jgi:uncharacterized phage protein (TIGR02216 family)